MKNTLFVTILTLGISLSSYSQSYKTENLIFITLDGLRWQEVFYGADSLLVVDTKYAQNPEKLTSEFWSNDPKVRRKILMPFFWEVIVNEGQLHGNRKHNSKVNNKNRMVFSKPCYNEIFAGYPDDERINSNSKEINPNPNILEFLQNQPGFESKIAAFASWDVFPAILARDRNNLKLNAGFEKASGEDLTEIEKFLNRAQDEIRGPWGGVRLDFFTHHYAMEELKHRKPKVLYIGYGETDDYSHDDRYDQYLLSARQTDAYIREVWEYVQSDPQYKDKTTLIIMTDHGRGVYPKHNWKSHSRNTPQSDEIWIAAIGPDTPALGEIKSERQYYAMQIARTMVELLGFQYPIEKAGAVIPEVMGNK
jgi:hypothetical protein